MTQNQNLAALSAAGVSVWLDDLSRDRIKSGNLQELIDTKCVVGVTTNPSIFQKALADSDTYDGFHLYDIDFSSRAARAGCAVGIAADLGLLHHSSGRFDAEYKRYARRFLAQHPALPLGPPAQAPAYARARLPDRTATARAQDWLDHWHALAG